MCPQSAYYFWIQSVPSPKQLFSPGVHRIAPEKYIQTCIRFRIIKLEKIRNVFLEDKCKMDRELCEKNIFKKLVLLQIFVIYKHLKLQYTQEKNLRQSDIYRVIVPANSGFINSKLQIFGLLSLLSQLLFQCSNSLPKL